MIHKITYCFVCAEEEEAISENEAEDPVKPEDIGVKGSEVKDALALEKSFAGGNGTKSDPYIVNTAALLNEWQVLLFQVKRSDGHRTIQNT